MALWPYFAVLTGALALVMAVFLVMLVVWSTHEAPNYWREEEDGLGIHDRDATSGR